MNELKPCPFCKEELFPGTNVHKKTVLRHPYNPKCPLSEAQFLDTPGFRESWNRRAEHINGRFDNCHIWEPGDNLATISDECEVLIRSEAMRSLMNAHLGKHLTNSYIEGYEDAKAGRPSLASNEPLTLDELKMRTKPVWTPVLNASWIPEGGYYCLCNHGVIIPPSGLSFQAGERDWTFLDHKPEVHIGVDLASGKDFTGYTDEVGKHIMQRFTQRN